MLILVIEPKLDEVIVFTVFEIPVSDCWKGQSWQEVGKIFLATHGKAQGSGHIFTPDVTRNKLKRNGGTSNNAHR